MKNSLQELRELDNIHQSASSDETPVTFRIVLATIYMEREKWLIYGKMDLAMTRCLGYCMSSTLQNGQRCDMKWKVLVLGVCVVLMLVTTSVSAEAGCGYYWNPLLLPFAAAGAVVGTAAAITTAVVAPPYYGYPAYYGPRYYAPAPVYYGPGPYYSRPGPSYYRPAWVPAHYSGYGYWVPGHWR